MGCGPSARDRRGARVQRSRQGALDPLLRALRRTAARPARALGVASLRAHGARRTSVRARRRRRQDQPLGPRRGGLSARRSRRAPGERAFRVRRRGGGRRRLDRAVGRAGRRPGRCGSHPRRLDDSARAAGVRDRRSRDALFPSPRPDGDDRHALGDVRLGCAERVACPDGRTPRRPARPGRAASRVAAGGRYSSRPPRSAKPGRSFLRAASSWPSTAPSRSRPAPRTSSTSARSRARRWT